MTVSKRTFLIWFVGGLAAFAVAIALHVPLITETVPGGIAEHQSARDGASVDRIHSAWANAGVYTEAHWAMVADLIFIGIYGAGCILGGFHFRANPSKALRVLGYIAAISGAVFMLTDYGETIAQFIQLVQNRGSDGLAQFASTLRPIKTVTWIVAFLAIIAALVGERILRRGA